MTINYKTTLSAIDAALATASAVDAQIGRTIRQRVAGAGQSYDYAFPPGAPSVLKESADHTQWSRIIAPQLASIDEITRLAEGEAVASNNTNPVVTVAGNKILLAPSVPTPILGSGFGPSGTPTNAICKLGGLRMFSKLLGTLGNAVAAAVVTTPGGPFTSYQLALTLGSYVETYPLVASLDQSPGIGSSSMLVSMADLAPGSVIRGTATFAGAQGALATFTNRRAQALKLPGVSAGTIALLNQSFAVRLKPEPPFNALASMGSGRRSNGPTLGSIEQALVDAIAEASSWLAVAGPP